MPIYFEPSPTGLISNHELYSVVVPSGYVQGLLGAVNKMTLALCKIYQA